MESLRELYKIGVGPSSSHTMGPQRAALKVKETYPQATHFEVYLHGSLALTGKGHLTDYIIEETLGKDGLFRIMRHAGYSEGFPFQGKTIQERNDIQ